MQSQRIYVLGAMLVLLSQPAATQPLPHRAPPSRDGAGIVVLAGTYGGNCGQPRGNKTAHLAAACNGRAQCTYTINYHVIGDPAVGCGKNYVAEWRCGAGPLQRAEAAPEAGYNKTVALSCGAPPPPPLAPGSVHGHGPRHGADIVVLAGTYGGNCGQPRGNKTAHLAAACNGRAQCTYTINYHVIGDPAVGCGKNYVAEWRCGAGPLQRAEAAPEAGYNKTVALSCGAPPPPPLAPGSVHGHGPRHGADIVVLAGTYGGNCGQPRGNKTAHLAAACNGRAQCTYTINYHVIGDPAVGCGKNYVAEWRCGTGPLQRAEAAPEAGYNKTVALSCP